MNVRIIKIIFWLYVAFLMLETFMPWPINRYVGYGFAQIRLDYIYHAIAYFFLGVLYIIMQYKIMIGSNVYKIILYLLCGLGVGIITEFVQEYIPERHFSIFDLAANALGIIVCYLIFVIFHRWIINTSRELQTMN